MSTVKLTVEVLNLILMIDEFLGCHYIYIYITACCQVVPVMLFPGFVMIIFAD